MEDFSQEERRILSQYFTNVDEDVFCLINLPEVIKGTLFSRYSRSSKSLRRLFLDEFFNQGTMKRVIERKKESTQSLSLEKAEDFYERILVGYGDDSVAELGGAHLAIENISVLATKSIEEHRIGLSPLEKSSRYVYFDKKVNNQYQYYFPQKIRETTYASLYQQTIDLLFETYSKIVHSLQPLLMKIYPGEKNEVAYRFSIRAKACDLARGLLPLATKTNLGIFGNGRAFEYLLIHLFNDPLEEVVELGKKINLELRKVIPAFIKRATNERGELCRQYLRQREENLKKAMTEIKDLLQKTDFSPKEKVFLLESEAKGEEKILMAILFENTHLSARQIKKLIRRLSYRKKEEILKAYLTGRKSRHHKVGRALENLYFTFEIFADWGVYKDLMRHRILTRHRQLFTNEFGYFIPEEIKNTPFEKDFRNAANFAIKAYSLIKKDFPVEAQYLTLHAAYNRFLIKMNLREAVHLCELRSSSQGHPSYRKIAQKIAQLIIKKYPRLGRLALAFVDYQDYGLERLEAFRKIARQAEKKGVKVFQ